MANNLYGFDKITNARFLIGEIENGFSIAENINGTPSNMKAIVVNDEREEYQVNTIVYHDHTDTWWVINADTSLYLPNGVYQHEIELIEGFEWFNYRTMIDCAFKKERYTLEKLLERLFRLSNIDCDIEYANFIDKDFVMPFFAFNNFTIASALKQISATILAIPKLKWTNGATLSGMTLYFISRIGDESLTLITDIDSSFPVAYEQNASTSDQYKTRAVSNISNAKSQELVLSPKVGGFQIATPTSFKLETSNQVLFLPSRIDDIEYIGYVPRITISYLDAGGSTVFFNGYFIDIPAIKQVIRNYCVANSKNITGSDIDGIDMPDISLFSVTRGRGFYVDDDYVEDGTFYNGMQTLKTEKEYNETKEANSKTVEWRKDRTWYWKENTNEVVVPQNFGDTNYPIFILIEKYNSVSGFTENIAISPYDPIRQNEIFFKVAYRPIADIKISYDNDYEAQDEKYYNQNGQLVDATIASKLMLTDVLESVEGTKIRQSRHNTLASCIKLGQLVKTNNVLWVVNQRSIEYTPSRIAGIDGYYSVVYNLSKDRIARSENINADSSIIDFSPPDKKLVERNQLIKDYVEFSLDDVHIETPYLVDFIDKLNFGGDYCGLDLDLMFVAKSELEVLEDREYMVMPSLFELTKSKLVVARFPDNNFIGQRIDFVSPSYIQTTINYVEADGSAKNIYGYFLSEQDIYNTNQNMITPVLLTPNPELLPFNKYPELPSGYWNKIETNNNWSIKVGEEDGFYDKDPFEIPVFSYQFQINNSSSAKGQIVVSDDILKIFGKDATQVYYRYLISPNIRFTNENALNLWKTLKNKTPYIEIVEISKSSATLVNDLYSLSGTPNTTALQGKHIGIFAITLDEGGGIDKVKFIFGVNFYQGTSNSKLTFNINNWKI